MLTPFVFDAAPDNLDALILGNSRRGLVLANFWAPKAGPCLILMPRLVRLATEYGGRFLLVMVNTDELGRQSRALGVTSVPTVKFFLNGEVVHTIHGAEPDSTFHAALARFLAGDRDLARQAAVALHQAGRTDEAIEALARLAVDEPANFDVALDLAKLLTFAGRPEEALALLSSLPTEARHSAGIATLLTHLELIQAAGQEIDVAAADAPAARFARAARALVDDDQETAMQGLLDLARDAPDFRDDIGRRCLLAIFNLLGSEHPLTRRYRAGLAALPA